MAIHSLSTLLLLISMAVAPITEGTVITNEDNPSLIDRILQVVWEPSSLIRMWVGLDQLYNIALSWRTVAKKLAALPFGKDPSESHVRIQEPRTFKYGKPSVATQWERFREIYSRSNLSPIVAHGQTQKVYSGQMNNALSSEQQPVVRMAKSDFMSGHNTVPFGLPPPFLFQPQEVFLDQDPMTLFGTITGYSSPFKNRDDQEAISKIMYLQKLENDNILKNSKYINLFGAKKPFSLYPNSERQIPALNISPQEKLNMLLKLLKNLGDIHRNNAMSANNLASMHPKSIADILAKRDK